MLTMKSKMKPKRRMALALAWVTVAWVTVLPRLFPPHAPAAAARGTAILAVPSLPELDAAIARAEPFVSQLYKPIPGQKATVAEYYDVPLRVYLTHYHRWTLLGEDKSAFCFIGVTCLLTTAIADAVNRQSSETFVAEFRSPGYLNSPRIRADINWDYDHEHYQIKLTNERFDDKGTAAHVYLYDRYVGTFSSHDVGHSVALTFAKKDISHLHSFRYTIRHGNQELQNYYWYNHDREKYERLAKFLVLQSYKLDDDVHVPIWEYGSTYPDDMPYRNEAYHDCQADRWSDNLDYAYRSKICKVGAKTYITISRGDMLTISIQAMHILNKYHDPERSYLDGGNRRYTPVSAAANLEQTFDRSGIGIPMCSPVGCNYAMASGIRTFNFGALETMLGYGYGRQESRGYADTMARLALKVQIGDDDTILTCDGRRFYRPVQKGAFYVSWDASIRYCQSKPFGYQLLADALNAPEEYQGVLVSNTETTDDAYAFLILYRCKKYGVGCATGAPKPSPSVTGLTPVAGRP